MNDHGNFIEIKLEEINEVDIDDLGVIRNRTDVMEINLQEHQFIATCSPPAKKKGLGAGRPSAAASCR